MECMKVDMRILVAKVEMAENNSLGEMQNLASKEHKPQKLIFAINKIKDKKKQNKEQDGKRGENSGHGEINKSVYEEKLKRLIDEVSKYKMILLTTRRTKEKLERALEI